MPERNSHVLQVLVGQMSEDGDINFIFGKTLRVLPETKSLKPVNNLLHFASRVTGPQAAAEPTAYTFCEASAAGPGIESQVW